ncbi:putative MHC class I antigen protein, partial [Naja naja]
LILGVPFLQSPRGDGERQDRGGGWDGDARLPPGWLLPQGDRCLLDEGREVWGRRPSMGLWPQRGWDLPLLAQHPDDPKERAAIGATWSMTACRSLWTWPWKVRGCREGQAGLFGRLGGGGRGIWPQMCPGCLRWCSCRDQTIELTSGDGNYRIPSQELADPDEMPSDPLLGLPCFFYQQEIDFLLFTIPKVQE